MNNKEDQVPKEKPQRNLLLVDDEVNITRSLQRLLRGDGYSIHIANSGKEGLDILKSNNIGVIISDQRMPEMNGTEFLCQVSKLYPDTIRIVLSGYTDLKSVTDAINEGQIYKFLTKPRNDDLPRKNIEEAFNQYELIEENRRLSHKLKQANDELKNANMKLANNVEVEARHVEINLRSLKVAQDILKNLPVGIMGVDEEKMIVFVNDESHKILSEKEHGLIGNKLDSVIPIDVDKYTKGTVFNESHYIVKNEKQQALNLI